MANRKSIIKVTHNPDDSLQLKVTDELSTSDLIATAGELLLQIQERTGIPIDNVCELVFAYVKGINENK